MGVVDLGFGFGFGSSDIWAFGAVDVHGFVQEEQRNSDALCTGRQTVTVAVGSAGDLEETGDPVIQ